MENWGEKLKDQFDEKSLNLEGDWRKTSEDCWQYIAHW